MTAGQLMARGPDARSRAHRALVTVAAVGALLAPVAGCGSDVAPAAATSAGTGWDAEIEQARAEATTTFEADALADGVVSDAEFQEMRSRLVSCLTGYGYTDVQYSDTGELSADFPPGFPDAGTDEAERLLNEQNADCEASSGERTLGWLSVAMRRNPDNLDNATITAECLVRRGAVDPGYTAADPDRDGDEGTGIFTEEFNEDFFACDTDPLGILGTAS